MKKTNAATAVLGLMLGLGGSRLIPSASAVTPVREQVSVYGDGSVRLSIGFKGAKIARRPLMLRAYKGVIPLPDGKMVAAPSALEAAALALTKAADATVEQLHASGALE